MRLHPGELAATNWRVEHLDSLVQRLMEEAPEVSGRPRIVAVDGRGGAGKTVLVERLQRAVPASAVVHTDDVAWNHAFFDWSQVMAEKVLRPLHRGEAVRFRPSAWVEHERPGTIDVPAGLDVVWVEGTGIIRRELDTLIDASIYIQADLDVQEQRLIERDGNTHEQQEHIARWLDEELPFMVREQPWTKATIIVAGASELTHDRDTEIVVRKPCKASFAQTCSSQFRIGLRDVARCRELRMCVVGHGQGSSRIAGLTIPVGAMGQCGGVPGW